jgi:hypothetical protein
MRRPHEQRVFGIIEELEGPGVVLREVAIPQAARFVDGLVALGEPSEAWGPIRSLVARRLVVLEHFSRPPSVASVGWALAKHAWLVAMWREAPGEGIEPGGEAPIAGVVPESDGVPLGGDDVQPGSDVWATLRACGREVAPPRPPLLLVLCAGQPTGAIAALGERGMEPLAPGIWRAGGQVYGDLVVVDTRGIDPRAPGTSVLRMVPMPRDRAEAGVQLDALLADPGVLDSTKQRLLEALMNRSIPTTDAEHTSLVDRLRAEGHAQGHAQGRREELLRLAELGVGAELAHELAGVEDLEELEERVLALLRRA